MLAGLLVAAGGGSGGRRSGRGWMEFDADEFIHDLFGTWKGYGARQPTQPTRTTLSTRRVSNASVGRLIAVLYVCLLHRCALSLPKSLC